MDRELWKQVDALLEQALEQLGGRIDELQIGDILNVGRRYLNRDADRAELALDRRCDDRDGLPRGSGASESGSTAGTTPSWPPNCSAVTS